jgi:hypothetical protein
MTLSVGSANTYERALLVGALTEIGFNARGFRSPADLMGTLEREESAGVLTVDASSFDLDNDTWDTVKGLAPSAQTIVIVDSTTPTVTADRVLPRPVSISEVVRTVKGLTCN